LAEPPPPELLEQLGIEPHCTCESRDDPYEPHRDSERGSTAARQYLLTGTSVKENRMRDIATATLSGNLTRDVELRELSSGAEVARLRVATTTRRRNGEGWVDKSNYFTVEVYGAQARACAEHLGKGSRVLIDAELDWREWTDQENRKREAVTFKARQVLFEGRRPGRRNGDEATGDEHSSPSVAEPVGATTPGDKSPSADDLPF
jgi:single-strand DNA-binding protein